MHLAIIGGGPAGLYSALEQMRSPWGPGSRVTVIEKANRPGGLLWSTEKEGCWWDNGTFLFGPTTNLARLMPDLFVPATSLARLAWYGAKFHPYPFSAMEAVRAQSLRRKAGLAWNYGASYLARLAGRRDANMRQWLSHRLTPQLLQWTQLDVAISKLQGGNAIEDISSSLGAQRLKVVDDLANPIRAARSILGSRGGAPPMRVIRHGGVAALSLRLAEMAQAAGAEITFGTRVDSVTMNGDGGCTLGCTKGDVEIGIEATHTLSTMPLTELAACCRPVPSNAVAQAAQGLHYTELQLCFYLVDQPILDRDLAVVYSFEPHHRWKRLHARSLPDGRGAIAVEVDYDPRIWQPDADIVEQVQRNLSGELGLFDANRVLASHTRVIPNAYPIYELGFEERVATLLDAIESDTFRCAGRGGRFQYASTHLSTETARQAIFALHQGSTAQRDG